MTVFRFCFFLIALLSWSQLNGQSNVNDTIEPIDIVPYDAIEIPSKSAQSVEQLNKIKKALLSEKMLSDLVSKSWSKLSVIDSLYEQEKSINLKTFNRRHLLNKRSYWKQRLETVEEIENELTTELDKLDLKRSSVLSIDTQWQATIKALGQEANEPVISSNITRVYSLKDTILQQLVEQESRLLAVQNRAIMERSQLTTIIDSIDVQINEKDDNLFSRSTIAYRELFKADTYTGTLSATRKNIKIEGQLLTNYLNDNRANAFLFIILLLSGMFAFRWVKMVVVRKGIHEESSYYQLQFSRLLSDYRSTAFVLFIWLSALLFPNQPILFKDSIRVLICIPLSILLYKLVDKRVFTGIIVLFAIILIQLPVNLFPPNNVLYQVFLLITALIEILVLLSIRTYVLKLHISSRFIRSFINRFLAVVIVTVGLSFVLGMIGYVALTELIVNIILTNTFSIALLFVSTLIANGMIEHLFDSMRLRYLKVFQVYGQRLKKRLVQTVVGLSFFMAVYMILISLKVDDEVTSFIWEAFTHQLTIGSFNFSLGRVILLIVVLTLSIFTSNVIKTLLEEDVLSRTKLGQGLPHTIALLAKYAMITIGITLALSMANIPMTSLTVLIGAFGVGIGFGLQNIFNNLVSGLILLFERPIKIDDVIEVGQLLGRVKSIGIRSSIVRTFDGAEVIVPNGQLISNEVINWTHSDPQRRHEVIVGVAYGSDVVKVKRILEEQLQAHKDILKDPEPSVLFLSMGESSLDFRVLFWISKVKEGVLIKSDVTQMIYAALTQAGITIPFPQRDIHIISQPDKK